MSALNTPSPEEMTTNKTVSQADTTPTALAQWHNNSHVVSRTDGRQLTNKARGTRETTHE